MTESKSHRDFDLALQLARLSTLVEAWLPRMEKLDDRIEKLDDRLLEVHEGIPLLRDALTSRIRRTSEDLEEDLDARLNTMVALEASHEKRIQALEDASSKSEKGKDRVLTFWIAVVAGIFSLASALVAVFK